MFSYTNIYAGMTSRAGYERLDGLVDLDLMMLMMLVDNYPPASEASRGVY